LWVLLLERPDCPIPGSLTHPDATFDSETEIVDARLEAILAKCVVIYVTKHKELAGLRTKTPVTPESLMAWAQNIGHMESPRMTNSHALAYYQQQEIRYNPTYVASASDDMLEDLVLHEMGHLFTWYFQQTIGHNRDWQRVGYIVGYVPVGCTTNENREFWSPAFAARRGL
jgi:hypothetical protein